MSISDEAVEAAAKAVWERGETIQTHEYATEIARIALEAAAPHLTQPSPNEAEEAMQKILITLDAVTAGQVPQDVAFTVVREISERWRKEQA